MQRIKLDINPKGEIPVLYVSQYDNGRSFEIELVEGEQSYNVPSGYTVQLNVRKTDSKLVTKAPVYIIDNIITFATSEQMTACPGENIASVTLKDADDYVITTLYFLISVQRDVLAGGLDSASEIHNLEQQIAAIVPEVIGNDYYNKSETDALLANKANMSDLANLASKAELEYAIDEEDAALKEWAFTQFATPGYIASEYYDKDEVDNLIDNIFPTLSASGAIASFTTALNKPLVSVTAEEGATTITRCGVNLWDEEWEVGNIDGTGADSPANDRIRSKGYIQVKGTTSVYLVIPTAVVIHKYGVDKSYLGNNYVASSGSFSISSDVAFIRFRTDTSYGTNYNNDISILYPSDTTPAYHAYNGQTVPVADATTLTTLSGVNNVFADYGDVTVQYKYMSM